MNDSASIQVVRDVVRREGSSVLQYLHDAYPWGTMRDEEGIAAVESLIAEERDAIVSLTRFLSRHRVAQPRAGMYPADFTSLNFIGFEYLLPRMIDYEKASEAKLRDAIAAVSDAEARELLVAFADMKKHHLVTLERLRAHEPVAA